MDSEKEIWIDVKGYEELYQVSNLGNVKSLFRIVFRKGKSYTISEKILKKTLGGFYSVVGLYKYGKLKTFRIHKLVATHFLYNPQNKKTINHINGIKTDNRVCNLEYSTHRENTNHYFKSNDSEKITGVSFNKKAGKFISTITHNKQQIHLGSFSDKKDAHKARVKFEKENGIINKYL